MFECANAASADASSDKNSTGGAESAWDCEGKHAKTAHDSLSGYLVNREIACNQREYVKSPRSPNAHHQSIKAELELVA